MSTQKKSSTRENRLVAIRDVIGRCMERHKTPAGPTDFDEYLEARRKEKSLEACDADALDRGITRRHLRMVLDGCDETEAVKIVMSFLADESESMLVISGDTGCGKTVAAECAVYHGRGRMIDAVKLQSMSMYRNDSFAGLEDAAVLVIDDVGSEFADNRGAFATLLDRIVNHRYGAVLKTIMTTNLTATEFRERYGERIADRIRECGRYVEIAGKSMRG